MTYIDYIIIAIIVLIIGGALAYIVKAKKSGAKCIGCPSSKTCSSCKGGTESDCCCGCGGENTNKE